MCERRCENKTVNHSAHSRRPTIVDEAQNELDPFGDHDAPLADFIEAV